MKKIIAAGLSVLLLAGCSHFVRSSSTYTVRQGDTINSIAHKFNVSPQDLTSYNNISAPYTIRTGQTLMVRNPHASDLPPAVPEPVDEPAPVSSNQSISTTAPATQTAAPVTLGQATPPVSSSNSVAGMSWSWPTQGNLISSEQTGVQKGINIAGTAGQPIYAAANGQVVFSGVGSGSYGNMIIIKSANNFLSAYGNIQNLMVKEGQQVVKGQQIGTMGQLQGQAQLHFEIRKSGAVVNPLSYLPAN